MGNPEDDEPNVEDGDGALEDDPETSDPEPPTEAFDVGRAANEVLARSMPDISRFAGLLDTAALFRDDYRLPAKDRAEIARTVERLGEMVTAGTEAQAWGARMAAQVEASASVSGLFDSTAVSSILASYSGIATSVLGQYSFEPLSASMRALASEVVAGSFAKSIDTSGISASLGSLLGYPTTSLGEWAGVKVILDGLSTATSGVARQLKTRFPGSRPANWGDDVDDARFDEIERIVRNEGIPLAWVPRPAILDELVAAVDRRARIKVLLSRQDDIVDDCVASLRGLDGDFATFGAMAIRAIDAYRDGHHEAALSLAVNVLESAVNQTMPGKSIHVGKSINFPVDRLPFSTLRCFLALFPLLTFYVPWKPGTGQPRPDVLSRHVIAHGLTGAEQEEEPLLAIMYAASVLRGLEDWVVFDVGTIAAKVKSVKRT